MRGSFTQRMARKASSAPALGAKLGISFPSGSNISAERSERSKRFAARGPANSRLSLTDHHSSDVGTVKELDDAVIRRLTKRVMVPLPDPDARRGLFQYLMRVSSQHLVMNWWNYIMNMNTHSSVIQCVARNVCTVH